MTIQAPVQLDLFDLLAETRPVIAPYDDWARCSVVDGHCAGCGGELAPRNGWHAGINHAQVNRPERYPAHIPVCLTMELTLSHFISALVNHDSDRAEHALRFDHTWTLWLDAGVALVRESTGLPLEDLK